MGLFGKLPARRDFIRHGVDDATLDLIEPWLHAGLHASRAALGDDWDAVYMDAPIWRFRCEDMRTGGRLLGVLMASVDGVGRKFPLLVLSRRLPPNGGESMPVAPTWRMLETSADRPWYDAAEDLALSALDECAALGDLLRRAVRSPFCDDRNEDAASSLASSVSASMSTSAHAGRCLWWAPALEAQVPPIAFPDVLPPPSLFTSLLTGSFDGAKGLHLGLVEDGAA